MKRMNESLLRIICGLILGIILVIWPDAAVNYLVITVGILFLIVGLIPMIAYLGIKPSEKGKWSFPLAALGSVLLGVWLVIMPGFFANVLMWLIGFVLVLGGIQQIVSLVNVRNFMTVPAGYYVVPVLILLAGLFSLFNPVGTRHTVFIIMGITSIVYALSELVNYMKFTRHKPAPVTTEVVDVEVDETGTYTER